MASGAPASAPAKLHGYDWWRSIGSPRLICAPMVDQSELAFRQLTREFGCELAVTPMLHARLSLEQPDYLRGSRGGEGNFSTAPADRPLLAQFCGNDAATLLAAGRLVEREVDGVDLNLGCPQGIARRGHYGSFLLEETALLEGIVSALHAGLAVPVTCKIRILPTLEATLALARALERAGCSMLTVHGRTRANMKQSITEADWGVVRAIKEAVGIPVVANGSVACRADVDACLRATGCDGVMVSEALLEDPGLFSCGQPTRGPLLARRGGDAAEALGSIDTTRVAASGAGSDDALVSALSVQRPAAGVKTVAEPVMVSVGEGSRPGDAALGAAGEAFLQTGGCVSLQDEGRVDLPVVSRAGRSVENHTLAAPRRCNQFELCTRYLELVNEFPAGWPSVKPHVFKMLFGALRVVPDLRQRRGEKARSVDEVAAIVREAAERYEASVFRNALVAGSAELATLRAEAGAQRERNPRCAWSEPEYLLDPSFPGSWYMRFRPDAYSGRKAPALNSEEMAPSRALKRAATEAAEIEHSSEGAKAAKVGEVTSEAGGCFTWGSC